MSRRQHHAIAIDDIGPRQPRLDRCARFGRLAQIGHDGQRHELRADRQERQAEADADEAQPVLSGEPARSLARAVSPIAYSIFIRISPIVSLPGSSSLMTGSLGIRAMSSCSLTIWSTLSGFSPSWLSARACKRAGCVRLLHSASSSLIASRSSTISALLRAICRSVAAHPVFERIEDEGRSQRDQHQAGVEQSEHQARSSAMRFTPSASSSSGKAGASVRIAARNFAERARGFRAISASLAS